MVSKHKVYTLVSTSVRISTYSEYSRAIRHGSHWGDMAEILTVRKTLTFSTELNLHMLLFHTQDEFWPVYLISTIGGPE